MFQDRIDAGNAVSRALSGYTQAGNAGVIEFSRGGVVVASAVSKNLRLSLDVLVVKKISSPEDNDTIRLLRKEDIQ